MASDVRIGILGPLEVRAGSGEPVELAGPRLRTLLVRLALDPGRIVVAGQLVDAVWAEDPPAQAANALQSLVSRLRRQLPGLVESDQNGYRLALDPAAVDAAWFESLVLAGRDQLRDDPRRAGATLRAALALWRGPALADVASAGFAAPAVARLEELRLGALEDRIEADLAAAGGEGLVAELEELVTAHPLRERPSGQLMRALARAGRQADALAAYERLRTRLADQLGIDPSEELGALHVAVLRGQAGGPAPRAEPPPTARGTRPARPAGGDDLPAAPRTNLRAQITSFVGRADDVARITGVLADARLVTLTGPGGAGKTRLAGEVSARLLDRMPDGVWMAELASVADPEELPQTLLSLLGAREAGLLAGLGDAVVPPDERLPEAIGDKRLLLVMDNCEHLVAAVAALVDRLLARCPALRVLATSREPLGITGEVLHPVGPLAVPDRDVPPAAALGYPAVRLFADRGAAVRPGFAVDQATVAPVLGICRALDGLPLAIELAAARLRALSPTQIAARLDDRFRLLGGGARPAAARHQTLRAVIDWSWDLLGDAERVLARRFGTFAGGATLEAVERVCAGPGPDRVARDEVLYLLAGLVDKSLLTAGPAQDSGEPRYWMLETVRAYAAERRHQAGEDRAVRRAHAEYCLDLAERADPELRGPDQLEWIARLTAERDNLNAALRWAIDSNDAALALRLVASMGWTWLLRSARAETLEWASRALALPGPAPPPVRARALVARVIATISGRMDYRRTIEDLDEALRIVEGLPGDEPVADHPLLALVPTLAAMLHNDVAVAVERARALDGHPDAWVRAMAHTMAGGLLVNLGEAAEAERELDLALAGFREVGERWGTGQVLVALADLRSSRGQHDAAVAALLAARTVFEELGDREDTAELTVRLAWERARTGAMDRALADLETAGRIAHEVGAEAQRQYIRLGQGEIARWQGRLDDARELLDDAVADLQRFGPMIDQRRALLLTARGHLEVALGDLDAARRWYQGALAAAVRSQDRPVTARVVGLLADIALAGGEADEAAALLGTAETLRGMPDEANLDLTRVRAGARAALGGPGFAEAFRRGAARARDEVLAELAAKVSSAAGTPAGRAEPSPPR